jgi:hypothetical protein
MEINVSLTFIRFCLRIVHFGYPLLCLFWEYCLWQNRDYYILIHEMIWESVMFGRLKKKPEPKVTEEPRATKKPKKPQKNQERTRKPAKAKPAEDTAPQVHAYLKEAEKPFVGITEYSSAMEIAEHIDKELAATKSALGESLRQLDNVRTVAEKAKRLHDVVAKVSGKKQPKENPEQIEVDGLEIVLDATPLHELTAIESVVRSHQQRLLALQKAREALEPLDPLGGTGGIRYLVLEKEGIPEQILLKLS